MEKDLFKNALSEHVWRTQYRWCEGGHMQEPSIEATWERVALAISGAEVHHHDEWREHFVTILRDFRFLPGGRILANAGTSRRVTLFDCFVMGPVEDSVSGIFSSLREAMLTLQSGGETGVDFSTLRPACSPAVSSGSVASGPVSFVKVWNEATAVLASGNVQHGSLQIALRCDHPDIESFIDAKISHGALPNFKLSVLLTEEFMQAVEENGAWTLVFPLAGHSVPEGGEVCMRVWPGSLVPQPCLVHRHLLARSLWDKLLAAEHAGGEPGVLFIDRINSANNLWYCEHLYATSYGGDIPLPAYGVCNLGAINLPRFVLHSLSEPPRFNFGSLKDAVSIAVRFLDNVHDISPFPLKAQQKAAWASRRIGLGVTGLADLFAMLGVTYGSQESLALTREIMSIVRDSAYRTSIAIAQEKGAFPEFDKIKYGASPFVLGLSHEIQDLIAQHGMRNSHLLVIEPTESLSLLANNVSSGMAPISSRQAVDVSVEDQLHMINAVQACVDNVVSTAVRLPQNAIPQEIGLIFQQAWRLGLKSCVVKLKDDTSWSVE